MRIINHKTVAKQGIEPCPYPYEGCALPLSYVALMESALRIELSPARWQRAVLP